MWWVFDGSFVEAFLKLDQSLVVLAFFNALVDIIEDPFALSVSFHEHFVLGGVCYNLQIKKYYTIQLTCSSRASTISLCELSCESNWWLTFQIKCNLQTVYLSRFSINNGYLVSLCIAVGIKSFNSSRRQSGWLAASYCSKRSSTSERDMDWIIGCIVYLLWEIIFVYNSYRAWSGKHIDMFHLNYLNQSWHSKW